MLPVHSRRSSSSSSSGLLFPFCRYYCLTYTKSKESDFVVYTNSGALYMVEEIWTITNNALAPCLEALSW